MAGACLGHEKIDDAAGTSLLQFDANRPRFRPFFASTTRAGTDGDSKAHCHEIVNCHAEVDSRASEESMK